jgi:hypothetical protein
MTEALTAARVRGMDSAELTRRLSALRDIELFRLPAEVVLALPVDVLHWRRDRLLASRHPLNGAGFCEVSNFGRDHLGRLRGAYLRTGVESYDALCAPDDELSDEDIKRPGDPRDQGRKSGSPRWTLGAALRWLSQWERADVDTLIVFPDGRKPPGRTPKTVPTQRGEEVLAGANAG